MHSDELCLGFIVFADKLYLDDDDNYTQAHYTICDCDILNVHWIG